MSEKVINTAWLEKAQRLKPELRQQKVYPEHIVSAVPDASAFQGWRIRTTRLSRTLIGSSAVQGRQCNAGFRRTSRRLSNLVAS
ncbi:hypothetical protein Q0F98_03385 [Paenibacillus amylolyticus]|nr:hypothetical protein Q0F98_03385 [Paenibacillus amylolyticus]